MATVKMKYTPVGKGGTVEACVQLKEESQATGLLLALVNASKGAPWQMHVNDRVMTVTVDVKMQDEAVELETLARRILERATPYEEPGHHVIPFAKDQPITRESPKSSSPLGNVFDPTRIPNESGYEHPPKNARRETARQSLREANVQ